MGLSAASRVPGWDAPPSVLSLAAGEIHLWLGDLDIADGDISELAASEASRAARLSFAVDRARFIARRCALRRLLGRYLGLSAGAVELDYGEHGKPRLASPDRAASLDFNLADSGPLCLLAIARGRSVGIDIERLRTDVDVRRVANRVLPPAEREALAALPSEERTHAFFTRWVAEEAALKLSGRGLAGLDEPAQAHRGASVLPVPVPAGYAAALATEEPVPLPRRWMLG
jgi:4'-phosphopantetheinyl transferase